MDKSLKGTKTEANLWAAFAGESQARNKYTYYASKAKTVFSMMHYLMGGKDAKVRYIRSNKIELNCPLHERTDIDGQPGPDFPLNIECLPGHIKIRI